MYLYFRVTVEYQLEVLIEPLSDFDRFLWEKFSLIPLRPDFYL